MKRILPLLVLSFILGSAAVLPAQSAPPMMLPGTKPGTNTVALREINVFSCASFPSLLAEKDRPVNQSETLQFLRSIPEFKELTLTIHTNELESLVATNAIYVKQTGGGTFWLLTPKGENIFVMFDADGECRGIERLAPIPVNALSHYLGEERYQIWMLKLRKLEAERSAKTDTQR